MTAAEVLEVPDDPTEFYEYALAQGWTDGLPVLPPTAERVADLLATTSLPAEHEFMSAMHPHGGAATVEKVAINAVMAGCGPDQFPFVLTAMQAICRDEFNLHGVSTTTGHAAPMLLVSGPSRDRVGIDYGHGCMGGATGRGSRTIGRAVMLCLRNIGGQRVGDTSMTCLGQPARFGLCFGEWEERSHWATAGEQRGFSRGDDVVHAHAAMGILPITDFKTAVVREQAALVAKSITYPATNKMMSPRNVIRSKAVLVINPIWADRYVVEFPAVDDFKEFLWEHATQPIDVFPESTRHMYESRMNAKGEVQLCDSPDGFVIMVAGGPTSLHAAYLPSFGHTEFVSEPVVNAR